MTRFISAVVFVLLLLPADVSADGGAVQFTKKAGPFTVTLFSAPVPLRVGICDLSVMVQDSVDGSAVLDGHVDLVISKPGSEISSSATRGKATNKLLYAANVVLPASGRWKVHVQVKRLKDEGLASGELVVLALEPPLLQRWPYFAIVPLSISLFVLNQWLKRQRKLSRRAKLP